MNGQQADLGHYVLAITKRLWLVAIIVAVAVGATYWRLGGALPTYNAQATLMVSAPVLTPSPALAEATFKPDQSVVTNDIIQLLTSRTIGERVAKRLGLPGPWAVRAGVNAVPVRESSFIRIRAAWDNPETAANLANVTAEEGIAYFRETNRASVRESRRFVEEQLALSRAKLAASERAIQAFKERYRMPSVEGATSQVVSQLASGQTALDELMLSRRETEVRLAAARAQLAREKSAIVSSQTMAASPVFQRIQARLVDLEMQRIEIGQVYTPQHPRMEQNAREIAELRSRLKAEATTSLAQEVMSTNPLHANLLGNIAQLEVDIAAGAARAEALKGLQGRRQSAMMALPANETEFNRLARESRVLESTYAALSDSYQQLILRENQAGFFPAGLQVIEAAIVPVTATATSFPRTAAAAGFVGLLLGVAAALFLETLDDRVRSVQDAEQVLGVPVLAQIPAQGQVRTAPATAIFGIGIVLVATTVTAMAVARGYVDVPATADGIRSVVATLVPWGR